MAFIAWFLLALLMQFVSAQYTNCEYGGCSSSCGCGSKVCSGNTQNIVGLDICL